MLSKEEIETIVIPVFKKYNVARASLFGSFVRGDQRDDSDVDIIIEFSYPENQSLLDLIAIEQEISELLNRKIDVLTIGSIHPLLKDQILSEIL